MQRRGVIIDGKMTSTQNYALTEGQRGLKDEAFTKEKVH